MARCGAKLRAIAHILKPLNALGLMLALSLLLSGCIRYDVGINFAGQNHGEIVQHIHLDEQLTNFSGTVAQNWLNSLEQRTRRLGGRVRHESKQDLTAIIPFNNGAELQAKFNQFFNPTPQSLLRSTAANPVSAHSVSANAIDLPAIATHLTVFQRNFFLVEKNQLTFDLDLRSLGVLSSAGSVLISPGTLVDLEFNLDTPWGARTPAPESTESNSSNSLQAPIQHLTWTLKAGEANHIEATFWVPSPIGIGTVAIAMIVAIGIVAKSRLL